MSSAVLVLIALVAAINLRLIADCLLALLGHWQTPLDRL
jgi:hypothetical protein